jgi:hypothetical protein
MPSRKSGYGYASLLAERFAMEFDALDLLQGLRREVALAAAGATDNGHILNNEQVRPFAVTARNSTDLCAGLTTNIANHTFSLLSEHRDEHQFTGRADLGDDRHAPPPQGTAR